MGQYNTCNGTLAVHTTHTLVHILHVKILMQYTNTTCTLVQILHWYKYYYYSTKNIVQRIAQIHKSMNDIIVYL